jgi:thiol-disulfide isomerase/thioredoxin
METKVKQATLSLTIMTALTIICFTLLSACTQDQKKAAPEFNIVLYDTVDFASGQIQKFPTTTSKVHVINFWFPSCPPCIAEMPELNKFYLEQKEQVGVIAIQLVGLDSVEEGQQFVRNKKIAFAVGADLDGKITTDYKVSVFPSTFFISADGNIRKVWQGQITSDEIKEIVTPMIAGKGG